MVRRDVLAVARRIMGAGGEAALTMTRLAEELDLSIGALYRYFPSRAAVISSVWEQRLEAVAASAARPGGAGAAAPADVLQHLAEAWTVAGRGDPPALAKLADLLDAAAADDPGAAASDALELARPLIDAFDRMAPDRAPADGRSSRWRAAVLLRVIAAVSAPPPSEPQDHALARRVVRALLAEWTDPQRAFDGR